LIDLDINVLQKVVVYSCDNFISAILAVDCHLIFKSLRSYFHDFKGLLLINVFKYKKDFQYSTFTTIFYYQCNIVHSWDVNNVLVRCVKYSSWPVFILKYSWLVNLFRSINNGCTLFINCTLTNNCETKLRLWYSRCLFKVS